MLLQGDCPLIDARFDRSFPVVTAGSLVVAVLALLVAACSGSTRPALNWLYQPRPDLARLYLGRDEARFQYPVIHIPGVFGARLRRKDDGEEVWPGRAFRLLCHDYEEIALPIDARTLLPGESGLGAYEITDEVAGRDYDGQIVRTLEGAGAYRRGTLGQAANPGERLYYLLVYDWRRDNVDAARVLDRLIEQIRVDFDDPSLKVDIVAHSMGGLRPASCNMRVKTPSTT